MRIDFIAGFIISVYLMNQIYLFRKDIYSRYMHLEFKTRESPELVKGLFQVNNDILKDQVVKSSEKSKTLNRNMMKIIGFADINFYPVAKYWYERLTSLGYTEHVIIAIDEDIYQACLKDGYRVEPYYVEKNAGVGNPIIRQLWYRRIQYCKEQVSSGIDILLTDVDNMFHKHVPLTYFQDSGYDIIHAYEQRFPEWIFQNMKFVLCGGMTWFTATSRTIHFLELLEYNCIDGGNKACNDQNTVNTMYLKYLNMTWNVENELLFRDSPEFSQLSKNKDLYWKGITGVSKITNHTVKIWDRDVAWRGDFETDRCPDQEVNWVSMPGATPYRYTCGNGPQCKKEMEKLLRLELWEEYCGHHPDATNRAKRTNHTLQEAYDRMQKKKKSYKNR